MANIKITDLTAYTDAASTDVLPIVDVGADVTKKITIGNVVKAVPLGTAALPGLAFDGDPNTGIYSPGADQVAISTNGTGRLFVDASGNVGVNAASPAGKLGVDGALVIGNQLSTGTTTGTLRVVQSTSSIYLQAGINTTTGSSADLVFSNINASNEWMRLTSAGRLGLGTSSPSELLEVSADPVSIIKVTAGTSGSSSARRATLKLLAGGSKEFNLTADASDSSFKILDSTTPRVTIDSSGRVGIGTTSPAKALDVAGEVQLCTGLAAGVVSLKGSSYSQLFSESTFYIESTPSDGQIVFRRNAGASESCRIDGSGRLLVGTSTARGVATSSNQNNRIQIADVGGNSGGISTYYYSADGGSNTWNFCKSRGASEGSFTVVNSGDTLGAINWIGSDGNGFSSVAASIFSAVDATPGANNMPGRLVFSTTADGASSPTGRMRIGNDGNHFFYSDGGGVLTFGSSKASGTTDFLLVGTSGATGFNTGTNRFFVFTNGNVQNSNNSYGAISDVKLKESIVDAKSQWHDLKALQVRNYNFKPETGYDTHTQIGLIAQEVELVSPGLVSESPDRDEEGNDLGTVTKSVNYSVLYMKAVKALQEAMERIETLEQRLNDAGIA